MNTSFLIGFFILELTLLFFISRISINSLFRLLHRFLHNEKVVFSVISFIFLPGTIIHELSHFFVAVLLFLKVRSFTVLPERENHSIKLGSVVYEKKDAARGILVGIAPIIVGLALFWIISAYFPFSQQTVLIKILMAYAIFILSSTMFSSKQDLVDMIYIVPFLLLITGIVYIYQIDVIGLLEKSPQTIERIRLFLYAIITYIGIALGIHSLFIGLSKLLPRS